MKLITVVDVNNLISIESGFSVGSYDVSQISEELVFRIGQKGETYKGIGKDEIKIERLPVLADKDGAIGSSTSDSERAMITEDVTEVLTLIYSFSGNDGLEKHWNMAENIWKSMPGHRIWKARSWNKG